MAYTTEEFPFLYHLRRIPNDEKHDSLKLIFDRMKAGSLFIFIFMQRTWLFMRLPALLLISALLFGCSKTADPPNILLILVDDLGYSDLQCYGNTLVKTPHIDQLSRDGIRFTQAYASCTVCSPTRAALLTGKNPTTLNLTDWIPGHQANRGSQPHQRFIVPAFNQQLPLEEITFAEKLTEKGYATASIGKWHLGGDGYLPADQGFHINMAGYEKGSPPSYHYPYTSERRRDRIHPLELTGDSLYLTDRLTNEALEFIRINSQNPFVLYLPFYNVHTPLQGRPDLVMKYEGLLAGQQNDSVQRNPDFLAMIESVDENVGRLMESLENLEIADRTLVILTSDNGGLLLRNGTEIRASWNYPLRAGKGTLYEGGLRIPAIISWPGKIDPGQTSDELIISTDLFPTFLEAAGIPVDHSIEGKSLLPHLLDGELLNRETLYWHYPHYHLGMPGAVIRQGPFKLIQYYEDGDLELYDLSSDTGESINLAEQYPSKVDSMLRMLDQWRAENQAQMPSPNPEYDPD